MKLNTLLTMLGYVRSLIEKGLGVSLKRNTIKSIYNYHRVAIGLNTSGQPTAKQFVAIQQAGAKVIINLAPSSAENSLHNESQLVEALGMKYIHLPVDFKAPTGKDFSDFTKLLSEYDYDELWIHCAANMRVSAFVYRYRCEVLGQSAEDAQQDMTVIWEPFGVWKRFTLKANCLPKR